MYIQAVLNNVNTFLDRISCFRVIWDWW